MSEIVGSIYKIKHKIGSGGGGNVYLAEHLNMQTDVVLKADKRKPTTQEELLRREVDILKKLRNSYIPQVHDYFVENDTVYTVMDYIAGESLNKPLERGERFSQRQVVKWAIQLLEALVYLHNPEDGVRTKGYVHGDIKPANIMRKPNNDICLIDFNIALAIGEENVVGFSAGYSSPEHYGLDYSDFKENETKSIDSSLNEPSVTKTIVTNNKSAKKIVPDARSDIYSLGATLYHFLSGIRPAKNALEVIPLDPQEYSSQIVKIIAKAMNPNPNLRYQSAEEMLDAFLNLRKNDERVQKLRKISIITLSILSFVLFVGISSSFVGLKRIQVIETWLKLSEYSVSALTEGDSVSALNFALEALPMKRTLLSPAHIPEAQKALTDALGIYDLSDGFKKYKVVELPSNPLYLRISPNGKTASCIYSGYTAVFETETAKILYTLPTDKSALSEVEYLDDENIVYAGLDGVTVFNITSGTELWCGESCTAIAVSQDKSTIATVYKDDGNAKIYDAKTGKIKNIVDFNGRVQSVTINDTFANPNDNLFELNTNGTFLGISFRDGSLEVIDLNNPDNNIEIFDSTSGYSHFEGGFYERYFAFSATKSNDSVFAVVDIMKKEQTGGFDSNDYFGVRTDANGIYVQMDNLLVQIDPLTGKQRPLVTTAENIQKFAVSNLHTFITSKEKLIFFDSDACEITEFEETDIGDLIQISNGIALIGNMNSPKIKILKHENHSESQFFEYDKSCVHDELRISADNSTVMLFNYKQLNIYKISGEFVAKVDIPNSAQVYDQQFIRDNGESWLEVTYNDGTVYKYSAKNGALLSETKIDAPDSSLYEEFVTDKFRIEAPLHGSPTVYNKNNGKKICEIAEEGYLTYVTQVDDYIVAQFVTTDSYYYGVIMNDECQVIGTLPYLCDVKDNELIFDFPSGDVRKSRILNINELIKLAQNELAGGI